MFLSACRQVARDYPGIAYDEDLLDRVCLQVIDFSFATHHLEADSMRTRLRKILRHTLIALW